VNNARAALAAARALGVERLDAQLLLAHVLVRDRAWLIANDDLPLGAEALERFERLASRRALGEPVAYLVGVKEFHGLALQVDARVLVPRPDTEVLVDWAVALLRGELAGVEHPAVVDLGTGSGAIALALRHAHPAARVVATDASLQALDVARANAERLQLPIEMAPGSWWQAVPGRRFTLAVANPPYIAGGDRHLAALHAEPSAALTPGPTGLEALDEIIDAAPGHLEPGGWLLLEHGFDQAEPVRERLQTRGFRRVQTLLDLSGQPRCSGGHL
jgi:release factor glutamine methyltransferase